MNKDKEMILALLESVGITVNGKKDYDIKIHNDQLYSRVIKQGALGLGEAYMDGWWDCKRLDEFFYKIMDADLDKKVRGDWKLLLRLAPHYIVNAGKKSRAFRIGQHHYDIGNDLYTAMLDKRMTYTCGFWENAKNLDEAQEAKLELVCKKIGLSKGKKVLDIGSGWGSFIGYAAEKHGAKAVGITVSKEQKKYADQRYYNLPVQTLLTDYRDIQDKFDHVVSLGMFEHVGPRNYRTFMKKVHDVLADDGIFLLHTIGSNTSNIDADPWLDKYIFPGGVIPSIKQIGKAIEGLFVMEDWHNFGVYYDQTLMSWHKNFEDNWELLKKHYDERFHRMWSYYLLMCAGSFRARKNQLWQIILSKNGVPGGYNSLRPHGY